MRGSDEEGAVCESDEEGVACESSGGSEASEPGETCEGGGDVELLPGVKLDDRTIKKKKRKKKKRKMDRETKELLRRQEVRSVCLRVVAGCLGVITAFLFVGVAKADTSITCWAEIT